jgi:hypothetical protein
MISKIWFCDRVLVDTWTIWVSREMETFLHSGFLDRTRDTAPEHPEQVISTLY